jgi:hypothetical protein
MTFTFRGVHIVLNLVTKMLKLTQGGLIAKITTAYWNVKLQH